MAPKESDSAREFPDHLFNKFSHFCDENIRIIKNVPYGLAVAGILLIGRSIHVSKQFATAKSIPQEFIKKGVKLRANVKQCTSDGNLIIEHIPIITLRFPFLTTKPPGSLTLRLVCVEHSEHSIRWLQENITNKRVWFTVLRRNPKLETLDGFVSYRLGWIRRTVINEHLIKAGLARVENLNKDLANHELYNKTLEKYLALEVKADKRGVGIWQRPSLKERLKGYPKQKWETTRSGISDWFRNVFKRKKKD